MGDQDRKDYFARRVGALEKERSDFMSQYRQLSHWIDPSKGRFLKSDVNKGDRRFKHIINSRALQAKRTAVSGMFTGVMSPSRPWFKLEPSDTDKLAFGPARDWMYRVEELMRATFLESNLYNMAPVMLDELLTFSTGAISHVDDFKNVGRFYAHPTGSYLIGQDERGEVDTFGLQKRMTASQIIQRFGRERVSEKVKNAVDIGNQDQWFDVTQLIEPNPDYNPDKLESKFKRWRSVWYEPGNPSRDAYLAWEGFDELPVYCPRWSVTGGDIYGTSGPGMIALGDVKALQVGEREKAKAVKKMVTPLLKGPPSLRNANIQNASDGIVVYDADSSREGLSAVYQIDPRLQELRADLAAVEERIDQAFFVDLFFAISSMQGVQPRNQMELAQRNEEALLLLGPVLERVQREFLAKLIDRTFNQLVRAEMLPEPPPELQEERLNIRFISSLAQAQRSVEVANIERFTGYVGQVAQVDPSALDKFNRDQAIDLYAHLTGVVPSIVVDTEQANEIRQQRAQQQQQEMQLQQEMQQASANVQNASAAKQISEIEQ